MFVKGILTEDFSENCVGRRSNRSLQMRTMTVSGSSPTNSTRRVVQYFYRNSVVSFREQKAFVLKTGYFTRIRLRHNVRESVRTRDIGLGI